MSTGNKSNNQNYSDKNTKAIVAPCRKLGFDAPLRWLKKGTKDFIKAPVLSLTYGLVMMVISLFIAFVAYKAHSITLSIALTAGFFFMGPTIAIGLYTMSRQISHNKNPTLKRCITEAKNNLSDELVLAFVFLIVFLIWARAASMVHVFFPSVSQMQWIDWIKFLSIGSAVGAVFASVVFCIGAFSVPMLVDTEVDSITAIITSINAVLRNKLVMIYWAMLIVVLVLISIMTFFIGFAFILPIVGHASWHAYRETIDIKQWQIGINQ